MWSAVNTPTGSHFPSFVSPFLCCQITFLYFSILSKCSSVFALIVFDASRSCLAVGVRAAMLFVMKEPLGFLRAERQLLVILPLARTEKTQNASPLSLSLCRPSLEIDFLLCCRHPRRTKSSPTSSLCHVAGTVRVHVKRLRAEATLRLRIFLFYDEFITFFFKMESEPRPRRRLPFRLLLLRRLSSLPPSTQRAARRLQSGAAWKRF